MIPSSCAAQHPAATPCIGVCAMDPAGFCLGCARTLQEIAAWSLLSHSTRLAIMEKLPARKTAVEREPSFQPLP